MPVFYLAFALALAALLCGLLAYGGLLESHSLLPKILFPALTLLFVLTTTRRAPD